MDPGIVDIGDGVDRAAVAQRLREEMERDRARADASKTRKAADRFIFYILYSCLFLIFIPIGGVSFPLT